MLTNSPAFADRDDAVKETQAAAAKLTARLEELCGAKISLDIDEKSFEKAAQADPSVWDWLHDCADYLEGIKAVCRNHKMLDTKAGAKMVKTVSSVSCRLDPTLPSDKDHGPGRPMKVKSKVKLYDGAKISLDKHTVRIAFNTGASNVQSALFDFLNDTFFTK